MKSRSSVVILLLFLWTLAPAMRCASEALTPAEQACCKAMGNACGEMGSHSCCEKAQIDAQPAVHSQGFTTSIAPIAFPVTLTGAALAQVSFTSPTTVATSPPPLLELSSVILRI